MPFSFSHLSLSDRVQVVFDLYHNHGSQDYIGEPVSTLEHMCQTAQLAESEGYDEDVILAAFFHDIGHLCIHLVAFESMGELGVKSHEKIGAAFLQAVGFTPSIIRLVENHVQAKRYLTFKHPEYPNKLSDASRQTLEYQGGIMSETEAKSFEMDPLFDISLKMRFWDESAKEELVPIPDLNYYQIMAENALQRKVKD